MRGPGRRTPRRFWLRSPRTGTKAIFFPIGLHATYEPAVLKQVAAAEHAIGLHTWCHQDLSKTKATCLVRGKRESVQYDPKDEIKKGISAVRWAVGGPTTPYFRFPALPQPPKLIEYHGKRNIGIFLHRLRFLRLQDAQARAGQTFPDGQAEEAWQRHCPDA
jgi:peptidoglycan/xylan/chitin deacetylase (PgdA/CDA1 family)